MARPPGGRRGGSRVVPTTISAQAFKTEVPGRVEAGKSDDGPGYSARGGNDPAFWLGRWERSAKADLKGDDLIRAVRRVMNIPMPAAEPAKAKGHAQAAAVAGRGGEGGLAVPTIPIYACDFSVVGPDGVTDYVLEEVAFAPIPKSDRPGPGESHWFYSGCGQPRYWVKVPALSRVETEADGRRFLKLAGEEITAKSAWIVLAMARRRHPDYRLTEAPAKLTIDSRGPRSSRACRPRRRPSSPNGPTIARPAAWGRSPSRCTPTAATNSTASRADRDRWGPHPTHRVVIDLPPEAFYRGDELYMPPGASLPWSPEMVLVNARAGRFGLSVAGAGRAEGPRRVTEKRSPQLTFGWAP